MKKICLSVCLLLIIVVGFKSASQAQTQTMSKALMHDLLKVYVQHKYAEQGKHFSDVEFESKIKYNVKSDSRILNMVVESLGDCVSEDTFLFCCEGTDCNWVIQ